MPQTTPSNCDGTYTPLVLGGSVPAVTPVVGTKEIPKSPERFVLLGVQISNVTRNQAIELLDAALCRHDGRPTSVFYANAHTLNLAAVDPSYRDVLNAADFVFADGTGVRWAARLQGVRILENMVGTDFDPPLFATDCRPRALVLHAGRRRTNHRRGRRLRPPHVPRLDGKPAITTAT